MPGRRVGERDGAQCGKLESSRQMARIRGGAYILSPNKFALCIGYFESAITLSLRSIQIKRSGPDVRTFDQISMGTSNEAVYLGSRSHHVPQSTTARKSPDEVDLVRFYVRSF